MDLGSQQNPIVMGSNGVPLTPATPAPAPEGDVVPVVGAAPVVAPAAPVAAAPQPALLDAAPVQATYIPTGVSQIDDIANLLSTSKVVGKEGIIKNVLANGSLTIADQIAISSALGESAATLIQNSLSSYVQTKADAATAETSRVKDYANSKFEGTDAEMTWSQLQAYAADNVPASQRSELNTMLQSGGLSAQMAVDHIYSLYNNGEAPKQNTQAKLISGTNAPAEGFKPLSKAEYSQAVATAVEQFGYDSHQVKSLQQRRVVSQQNGY